MTYAARHAVPRVPPSYAGLRCAAVLVLGALLAATGILLALR